ncbi:hypothetical protein HMPREF0262_01079 [Clostridium sp. ATCC 29733]|nr:hypothetical protein HMPREF0262_01079 [Clostridium sp. ATCC 29733]
MPWASPFYRRPGQTGCPLGKCGLAAKSSYLVYHKTPPISRVF